MPESVGVEIQLKAGQDADKTAHCIIRYRETGSTTWLAAFPPDRINYNGVDQFRGSLFMLKPGTSYEIHAEYRDSSPLIETTDLGTHTVSTPAFPSAGTSGSLKWVSPSGSGTVYTAASPGNLKTLLASGYVACGTTVMLTDGTYSDINMSLNIAASCPENSPITLTAAPGAHPVFDGAYPGNLTWTKDPGDPNLYSATLPSGTDFTNLCVLGNRALYAYPTLTANILFGNYNLSNLNLGFDGFVRNQNQIWLKTARGMNPGTSGVTISKAFRWLTVYGNDKTARLRFKGITVKNIGKSNVSGTTEYGAVACDIRGASDILFDSCTFLYNNSHIAFSGQCDRITVQHCRFVHDNGRWTHAMIKKSLVTSALFSTSQGRGVETGAIELSNTRYLLVRNNIFSGVNSGVVSQFSSGLIEEADICDNLFEDNFDAIEADGNWVNARILRNNIVRPMAGISMAPPMIGPRYIYRNIIHGMQGRRNEQDDPYFVGCTPVTAYRMAGIGFKTNPLVNGNNGNIYLFNNTFSSADSLGYAFTTWDQEWRRISMVNNIFCDSVKHPGYFHSLASKPAFQWSSDHDNYYSHPSGAPLVVAKELHGQYQCHAIVSAGNLESKLREISGSNLIQFKSPMNQAPDFNADFSLKTGSPLKDAGSIIPGFYDYHGTAPEPGAKELAGTLGSKARQHQSFNHYPNPADQFIQLRLPPELSFGYLDFSLIKPNGCSVLELRISDPQEMIDVTRVPDGLYMLKLETNGRFSADWIYISHR